MGGDVTSKETIRARNPTEVSSEAAWELEGWAPTAGKGLSRGRDT